jgi:hypothetical protein
VAKKKVPHVTPDTTDQRIFTLGVNRGYSLGYDAGHTDGWNEGVDDFQEWLLEELRCLAADITLELRHDVSTPLQVLAAVREIVEEGQQVPAKDDDDA